MDTENRTDVVIAAIATRAHGVVTRERLLAAGVTPDEIRRRVARGSLIPVHRGVFRVGHAAPSVLSSYAAAVLACGERAALAGLAAAHLHRLTKVRPSVISVIAPTQRSVRGIRTLRSRVISEEEVTTKRAIPVTSVARTLVDLAPVVPFTALVSLCHEAKILHRLVPADVVAVLVRHPKAPGAAAVRRAVGAEDVQLGPLERAFRRLLRTEGLPLPQTNRLVGGRLVDCRWPGRAITVELDSYTFHNSRQAWERDRAREREAYARGDAFRRYAWRDVTEDPRAMLRELRELLS